MMVRTRAGVGGIVFKDGALEREGDMIKASVRVHSDSGI
jgi:hypothetical protein